jgi:hypothetical protein
MLDVEKYHTGCKIIYGYNPGCLDDILDSQGQLVILIEPRTDRIDQIQSLKIKDFILIKKVLVKTNLLSETIFHYDKDRDIYFMKDDGLVINGTNLFNIKKYKAYTTSMENIIKEYAIQNIHSLTININIKNCNEIIQSVEAYNHILSRIYINKQIGNYQCKILDDFYSKVLDQYITFTHKNLHIELPKILVYFYESQNKKLKEMTLLMQQYKMALVINKLPDGASARQDDQQDTSTITNDTGASARQDDLHRSGASARQDDVSVIVPYPESIKYIDTGNWLLKPSKIYYENVINNLACIFDSDTLPSNSSELDIIIQFNPKYFDSKNTLQIMYPLDDNVFYINKVFDVIYGTKNCMFMLYQILKSKYFTDYIEEKIAEKKSLFKIFSKRYFYDYISKIFIIKEI